jgi:hypothetical protein
MAGPRSGDQVKWWLIVAAVLAFIVSGTYVGLRQVLAPESSPARSTAVTLTPSPLPSNPPTDSVGEPPQVVRPAGDPLLPGAGVGDVFVQSAHAIYRIELATGRVIRTPTPVLAEFSSFVAGPGWVALKTASADSGVVVENGRPAVPLPTGLRPAGRLLPAPDGDLWLLPETPSGGVRVAARVGIEGYSVSGETIQVPAEFGILRSDGAGLLVLTSAGKVYQLGPSGPRRLTSGSLVAVGQRFLLVWDCDDRARCLPYRLDRTTGQREQILPAREEMVRLYQGELGKAADLGGELSPDGTHVALTIPRGAASREALVVVNLTTGRSRTLPGTLTDLNGNARIAWTPNGRWLLAITDHQMRAYDTSADTSRLVTVTDEQLRHLTMAGAPGT